MALKVLSHGFSFIQSVTVMPPAHAAPLPVTQHGTRAPAHVAPELQAQIPNAVPQPDRSALDPQSEGTTSRVGRGGGILTGHNTRHIKSSVAKASAISSNGVDAMTVPKCRATCLDRRQ